MSEHACVAAQPEKARKLMKSYVIGFVLLLIYVLASYAMVTQHWLTGHALYEGLVVSLLLQMLVQVICYLRLNSKTEDDKWNMITFVFTLIIIAIVVVGSLWIMYNLNYYMVS